MYYLVEIYKQEDFEVLRALLDGKTYSNRVVVNIKNDIEFDGIFKPINAEKYDITINGNNHVLSGLCINYVDTSRINLDYTGLFGRVNSLNVYDLCIDKAYVYGGVKCGVIAGEVFNDVVIDNLLLIDVIVNSEAFAGGVIGRCKNIDIINSTINVCVNGHDVVGGVVGMTNKYISNNNIINTDGLAIGKAIGNEAGYSDFKLRHRKN